MNDNLTILNYNMSNAFTLEKPQTKIIKSAGCTTEISFPYYPITITIGINGFKMVIKNQDGSLDPPNYILFDEIYKIGLIEVQDNIASFQIEVLPPGISRVLFPTASPQIRTFIITTIIKNITQIFTLINEGYQRALSRKDELIGI